MKSYQQRVKEAAQRAEARAKRTPDEQMKLILSRRGHSGREVIRLHKQAEAQKQLNINKKGARHG